MVSDSVENHLLMHYIADKAGLDLQRYELESWYYSQAVTEYHLGPFLNEAELIRTRLAELTQVAFEHGGHIPRVSIVGYHRAVLGLGEDARCLFDCLCAAGIAPEMVDASPPELERFDRPELYQAFEAPRPTGTVLIFCLPAIEMVWAVARLGITRPQARQHRIGYWPWETSRLPSAWHHVFDLVDEVWASSSFLHQAFQRDTDKPVFEVPLHVNVAEVDTPSIERLFDARFAFVTVFDFNSWISRKNPTGTIEAFRRAFDRDRTDVRLILKSLHAATRPDDVALVRKAIGDDDRILLLDAALPKAQVNGLIAKADAYVSLHRAEGFGRPIAEAMLLGTPVIATGWSGCSDFLNEETGFPVRSDIRPVKPGEYGFASGDWAEPDLDHAASLMREVYENVAERDRRARVAKTLIKQKYGRAPVSERLVSRLASIS